MTKFLNVLKIDTLKNCKLFENCELKIENLILLRVYFFERAE